MIRRLLVDYGEVISTPLPENTIIDLAALAGQPGAPGEVWFIDDRAENTRTARDLGMHSITFASASALDRGFLAGTGLDLTSPW